MVALLSGAIVATLVYFYGALHLFTNGQLSTWTWAWQAWTPETNYEHAKFIPLIVAFLIWYDRAKLKNASVGSSRWGWLFIGAGLFLFVAGARTLQARLTLTALPVLLFGIVLYVWGKAVARVLLFPIAFLLFMVPLNFLTQSTLRSAGPSRLAKSSAASSARASRSSRRASASTASTALVMFRSYASIRRPTSACSRRATGA